MMKKRILLIDDEENFTKLVKFNLEGTGRYEVRTENTGSRGLAVAKEFKPDLVLLDVMMPEIDGGEVCYQLDSDEETNDIPVVFLTAAVDKQEVENSSGVIGGRSFIAKPVSLEKLVEFIEKNIRGSVSE
ncbi:MAG: response regulator [Candidatus Omnitrophota bacterium]